MLKIFTSKILKDFRIQIPDEIVDKYNLSVGDIVQWETRGDKIIIHFVKREDWEKEHIGK